MNNDDNLHIVCISTPFKYVIGYYLNPGVTYKFRASNKALKSIFNVLTVSIL